MMRALVQPFDFIIADEPISHLDDTNSQLMSEILMEEARQQGAGVIITSIGKRMEIPYDFIIKL
jgi:ABC-type phosphate/phosphonate transport system ATPase subunit